MHHHSSDHQVYIMKVITVPCLFDNYGYLIICEETGAAAVVDPAEFYPISSEIERAGVQLQAIYCTHHHADHIGGLEDLLGQFPGIAVYGHESDRRRIQGMNCSLIDGSEYPNWQYCGTGHAYARTYHRQPLLSD